jgi:hypothetical protein
MASAQKREQSIFRDSIHPSSDDQGNHGDQGEQGDRGRYRTETADQEDEAEERKQVQNLQDRAAHHLEQVVSKLVELSGIGTRYVNYSDSI